MCRAVFYACGLRRFFDQFTSVAGRRGCRALRRAKRQRHGCLLIGIARFARQRQGNALSRRIILQQLLQCAHRFHACAVKLREHIALFKARRGGRAAALHCGEINALRNSVGAGLRVLGVPQPSGFAGPQLVEACPVVAGPAALCGRAGCVGFGLRGGRVP